MSHRVIARFTPLACVCLLAASQVVAGTVDFEDLSLAPESHFAGPQANATDEPDPYGAPLPVKVGSFQSGGMTFGNEYNPNYGNWAGFAYSNETDTTTSGYENQFSSFAGSGAGVGDDNFGVVSGYKDIFNPANPADLAELPYMQLAPNTSILGAMVTNVTYVALSMLQGDSFSKKFGGPSGNDADWFKLTAYGTNAAGNPLGVSAELYLADYRSPNNADDYVLDEWTFFDLSALAGATTVYFNLASSDNGDYGMNTPAVFAIDNISFVENHSVPEPSALVLAVLGGGLLFVVRRTARSSD